MKLRTGATASGLLVCSILAAACSSTSGSTADEPVAEAASADSIGEVIAGAYHFSHALPGTNGRACATCHVPEDHFTLTPQHVQALYAKNPKDPLFNPIDSDDPTATVPTYNHLMAGLVRVTITLADNLDVIDESGNVITNDQRTVSVWRGVPSIENVAFTGPYQYDGRAATLPIQVGNALQAHSEINHAPSAQLVDEISDFEKTVFSGFVAAEVGVAVDQGQTTPPYYDIPLPPHSDAAAGQVLFKQICATCHGTGTTNAFTNLAVENDFFPAQNADGTIDISGFNAGGVAIPKTLRTDLRFPQNMGSFNTALTVFQQLGILPNPSGVTLPHYRIRFYTDGTRTQKQVDMPPAPPSIGPSLVPEPWTVDPGRSLVSGNPYDWEGFKVLQLRGISKTAPYFHDGSAPDLHAVLDTYSRFLLQATPALNLGGSYPPEAPGLPPEALSPTQKAQLFAFLQYL